MVGCCGISLVELMDEWESNTYERICWGFCKLLEGAGQLQERRGVSVEGQQASCRGTFFWLEGGVLFGRGFFRKVQGFFF